MVREDQIATVVPRPAERPGAGHDAGAGLRQPRFLKPSFIDALRQRAAELGFDQCRIAAPDAIPQAPARLKQWLGEGAHGDMDWMEETADRRSDPRVLWSEVRSVIVLAVNYGPDTDPLASLDQTAQATISVYARNRDYHELIKGRLKMLAQFLVSRADAEMDVKVFVDTAPVMEKPLAAAAGIGWQGKHTNLVSRDHGSWLFLGTIFTTLPLPIDPPESDHCGSCRACLDACPTNAFPAPYRLDARRCISYLTIEYKGHIDRQFRTAMGNRIYGCDDCLAACPWNKFAAASREAKFQARDDLLAPPLADLAALDDAAFRSKFAGSPIKRIGRDRFVRNVMIAIGNSADARLIPTARAGLDDAAPVVRAMAVWALQQLLPAQQFAELRQHHHAQESDSAVLAEWAANATSRT
ncbi:MAG TPA: tRNA epoxyqueuosine(34) reductase QueG [Beijerinckiaceae bacterium]|nr:tRNA epoxyqueuosine(34) reductase QueG [Beijerinckiaceae bacterium]